VAEAGQRVDGRDGGGCGADGVWDGTYLPSFSLWSVVMMLRLWCNRIIHMASASGTSTPTLQVSRTLPSSPPTKKKACISATRRRCGGPNYPRNPAWLAPDRRSHLDILSGWRFGRRSAVCGRVEWKGGVLDCTAYPQ
jgi:hypothetical protein